MSYNGSGTFNINSAGQPVVPGTVITSTAFNALTSDLATGLSTALTKDGQTTPTANIPLGGYKITGLGAGTAAADAVRFSQLQTGSTTTFITAAGTDTITGTVTPTLTAYATGQQFSFVVAATNTGAVTLNVDGVGAKAVTRTGSVALVAGDMVTGQVVIVEYDGTRFQLLNGNSFTNLKTSSITMSGGINSARGNITQHATTMDFFAVTSPDNLDGTGAAVTITACVNAPQAGATRKFYPLAATVCTHGATFDIVGNANITAAAGDCWIIEAKTVSTYRVSVVKEDGTAVVPTTDAQWTITPSRTGNAETFTVTPIAGATLRFRNATLATGDYTDIAFSSAITLTLSSGSTVGASNNVSFRLWLVAFNDAGTLRLGAVKTLSGASIMHLRADQLYSSTAEGGAGAADSAQVIYTTTAVTTKAIAIIGYLEYSLATAGTWNTAPTKIQIYEKGVALPGDTVQVSQSETGNVSSGSTVIPIDSTVPQNTEGDQYMTQAITPASAANLIEVEALATLMSGSSVLICGCLFQDSTANAYAFAWMYGGTVNPYITMPVKYKYVANSVSSTTWKFRAGPSAAASVYFNQSSTATLAGTIASGMTIKEVQA